MEEEKYSNMNERCPNCFTINQIGWLFKVIENEEYPECVGQVVCLKCRSRWTR